jgi:hypothetical protein
MDSYKKGNFNPKTDDVRDRAIEHYRKLRLSLFMSFATVLLTIFTSVTTGWVAWKVFGKPNEVVIGALQLLSAAFLLWGTIWELGWDVRSMDGDTLVEKTHQWLFRSLFVVGTGFLFFSVSWSQAYS